MNILEARRRTLGADVYKKTAEGNSLIVRSLARMRPGLNVYGKSTQQTTTGAQLFPLTEEIYSRNGITLTRNADGTYTPSGTPLTLYNLVILGIPIDLEPGEYYLSGANNALEAQLAITKESSTSYKRGLVTITGEEISVRVQIQTIAVVETMETDPIAFMLNKGSSALPIEPYTGGKPSPSPDYPQEIVSVGDDRSIQVDVYGGNLYDSSVIPEKKTNGVTAVVMDDKGIRLVGDTRSGQYAVFNVGIKKDEYPVWFRAGKMTVSISSQDSADITNVDFGIRLNSKAGTYAGDVLNLISTKELVRTLEYDGTEYEEVELILQVKPNSEIDAVVYVMLNYGDSALPYEPCKQPQSLIVSTPNGLPGIPVSSGGNYTDENGQQWICDEIDFKRGKYVQRILKYVPAEQMLMITNGGLQDTAKTILCRFDTTIDPNPNVGCAQNNFVSKRSENMWLEDEEAWSFQSDGYLDFRINKDRLTEVTLKAAKQFCAEIGAYFYYALGVPIETDLTEEQMAAYANLRTNRPTTVVSATDGAGLRLTYKTKKSLEVTD